MCVVRLCTPCGYLTNSSSSVMQFAKICVSSSFSVHCMFCMCHQGFTPMIANFSLYQQCQCKVIHVLCQYVTSTSNYCCPWSRTLSYVTIQITAWPAIWRLGENLKSDLVTSGDFVVGVVKFRDFEMYTITERHRRKFQNWKHNWKCKWQMKKLLDCWRRNWMKNHRNVISWKVKMSLWRGPWKLRYGYTCIYYILTNYFQWTICYSL